MILINAFELVGVVVLLIFIGFLMGRNCVKIIDPSKPKTEKLPKPSKPTPEPEGDLFNDAMRGKPSEEKVETVKK